MSGVAESFFNDWSSLQLQLQLRFQVPTSGSQYILTLAGLHRLPLTGTLPADLSARLTLVTRLQECIGKQDE